MKILLVILLLSFTSEYVHAQKRFPTRLPYQKLSESNPDVKILRAFNNIESPFLHSIVSITNTAAAPVSLVAPVGLYAYSRVEDNRYDENTSVLLALSEVLNLGVTLGMKDIIRRDRPFRSLNNIMLSETLSVAGSYSFPSGHTSSTFTLATLLTLRYPDNAWIISGSYFYATVTSLGRLYWGVHYPSDVLGGMLIGAGSAALIYSLRDKIIPAKDKLFNQSGKPDQRKESINVPVLFSTMLAADLLNLLAVKLNADYLNGFSVNGSSGATYNLNFTVGF